MRLFAFQGLHYDFNAPAEELRAGELAAPPYDQIDEKLAAELQAVSPYHFTHLTKPRPGDDDDIYRHAAHLHRQWLEAGIVERDPEPAIYPYVIEFPDGARRLGVKALIGIEPPDSTAIRPHERTLAKPLADRLALLEAMRVDLEPALFVSDDAGELDELLRTDTETAEPLIEHRDGQGYRHLLFRVTDPERIARYREVLDRGAGAIADGHHRYKVARELARKLDAAPGTATDAKLAVVTSLESPALTIDPIHRALGPGTDVAEPGATVVARETWEPGTGGGGTAFAAAVAAAGQPAVGVMLPDGTAEIWRLDPEALRQDLSAGARKLPVVLLHEGIFSALGLDTDRWTDGTVVYRSDPEQLAEMVRAGEAGVGFFLPPMEPAAFAAAIAEGDLLPPKSTRFLPKVISGLVWADHDSRLV